MERTRNIAIILAASALVAGVAVFLMIRPVANGGGSLRMSFPLVAIALLGLVLLAVMLFRAGGLLGRLARRGKSSKTEKARDLGFSYEAKGETAFRRSFSDLPGIPDAGKAKHVMRGSISARQTVIFEHTYLV